MNCPKCGKKSKIIETRQVPEKVVRLHRCWSCEHEFITMEVYVTKETGKIALSEGRKNIRRSKKEA